MPITVELNKLENFFGKIRVNVCKPEPDPNPDPESPGAMIDYYYPIAIQWHVTSTNAEGVKKNNNVEVLLGQKRDTPYTVEEWALLIKNYMPTPVWDGLKELYIMANNEDIS